YGAAAVLTALQHRERTGDGALVDLSQHEGAVSFVGEYYIGRQLGESTPMVTGNGHLMFAPHGTYRCAGDDNWIVISACTESEWMVFAGFAGCRWEFDPRFESVAARRQNRSELDSAIE